MRAGVRKARSCCEMDAIDERPEAELGFFVGSRVVAAPRYHMIETP